MLSTKMIRNLRVCARMLTAGAKLATVKICYFRCMQIQSTSKWQISISFSHMKFASSRAMPKKSLQIDCRLFSGQSAKMPSRSERIQKLYQRNQQSRRANSATQRLIIITNTQLAQTFEKKRRFRVSLRARGVLIYNLRCYSLIYAFFCCCAQHIDNSQFDVCSFFNTINLHNYNLCATTSGSSNCFYVRKRRKKFDMSKKKIFAALKSRGAAALEAAAATSAGLLRRSMS